MMEIQKMYIILIISLLLCNTSSLFSDWSPETRLTFDSGYSGNRPSNRWIACDLSENVHIVWHDNRDGNFEIYYKEKKNEAWSSDFRLTYDDSVSENPAVVIDSTGTVYVVWQDNRDGHYEIYFFEKENDSLWIGPTKLTNTNSTSLNPSISGLGWGTLHLVWQDDLDGDFEIFYKKREQSGIWNPDTQLTHTNSNCENSSIIGGEGGYILSWQDFRDGNFEIYYRCNYSTGVKEANTLKHYPSKKNISLQISPNPFISEVSIKLAWISHEQEVELQIYDASGRLVKSVKLTTNSCQLGADFIPGIYFLKLYGKPVGKVVKVR